MKLPEIKNTKVGDTLRDDVVRGLLLRHKPTVKAWSLYYRSKAGQQREPKIGEYPTIGLEQAREIARGMLATVAQGGDPSRDRAVSRKAERVQELTKRFMDDHARENNKAKTVYENERFIERFIDAKWGKKPVADITGEDVRKLKKEMKGTPTQFNRVRALISKIWNFAKIEPNIVDDVTPYRERKRERYLEPEEFPILAAAIDQVEKELPQEVAIIRLLLLSGARPAEIQTAERKWLQGNILTLKDHKTDGTIGTKVVVLPDEALDVLKRIKVTGKYLCGRKSRPTRAWRKIMDIAKLPNFRLYDLRHSFASEALDADFTLDQIGKLFGHTDTRTTARYAHLLTAKRMAMASDTAGQIGAKMRAKATAKAAE